MVLDSNVLIDYLNGDESVVNQLDAWKQTGQALIISSISVAEVLAMPALSPSSADNARAFLRTFFSRPFDDSVAEVTALFRRKYALKLPDAAIIATAFIYKTPLVTRDKQLRRIKEITVLGI